MNDFKESIANLGQESIKFKAKIQFNGNYFYILDNFMYDNKKYYYIIEDKTEELEKARKYREL